MSLTMCQTVNVIQHNGPPFLSSQHQEAMHAPVQSGAMRLRHSVQRSTGPEAQQACFADFHLNRNNLPE